MNAAEHQVIELLSIPQYLLQFQGISDLGETVTSMPCPLPMHKEKQGKSFSYDAKNKTWTCFGKCNCRRKDVIDLHQRFLALGARADSCDDLRHKLALPTNAGYLPPLRNVELDEADIKYRAAYQKALYLARDINSWIELDYIMSFSIPKPDLVERLENFIVLRS